MDVIDLNCDMGESFGAWTMGSDAEMLKIVTSANVACGFHGGDPLVMFETVSRAKENRVGIGAHPSFFDVWGFGRRMIQGETDPARLAEEARGRLRQKAEPLRRALEGRVTDHHRFLLRALMDQLGQLEGLIEKAN